ncbi:type IV pilus biogenesis protein PilP [Erwinia papayae]|uniref:Type IV pilus biogenesis protein PilP n=1 Tax=Erwinia papayae TaxID=206499 RepID=A0ABV3MYG9_9GAMM
MRRTDPAGACLLLSVMFSGPLLAAGTGHTLPPNARLDELEAVQARYFILEQKVQTARLEQQLRESLSPQSGERSAPFILQQPAVTPPGASQSTPASTEKTVSTVRLQEIYGRGTQLRARILLPNGGVTEVAKGDQIPGTSKRVTEVTATVVRLSDNSELTF